MNDDINYKDESYDKIRKLIKCSEEHVISCVKGTTLSSKVKPKIIYLVTTNHGLFIFRPNILKTSYKLKETIGITSIKRISYSDESSVFVIYGSNSVFYFSSEKVDLVVRGLVKSLDEFCSGSSNPQKLLVSNSSKVFRLDPLMLKSIESPSVFRYKSLCYVNNWNLDSSFLNALNLYENSNKTTFYFKSSLSSVKLNVLSNVLAHEGTIDTLCFDNFSPSNFAIVLKKIIKISRSVKCVILQNYTDFVFEFGRLGKLKNPTVNQWIIRNCFNDGTRLVYFLLEFKTYRCSIQRLEIENVKLTTNCAREIENILSTFRCFSSLEVLIFRSIEMKQDEKDDICSSLFQAALTLKYLGQFSVEFWNPKIKLPKELKILELEFLTRLILAQCNFADVTEFKFGKYIRYFSFSGSFFDSESFHLLMNALSSHKSFHSLDLSELDTPMDAFSSYLDNENSLISEYLVELNWSGNPITASIIPSFDKKIIKAPNLRYLSLNNCFSSRDSKVLLNLLDCMIDSKIWGLSIDSPENNALSPVLFMPKFQLIPNLKSLSVMGTYFTDPDEVLPIFRSMNQLNEISIDKTSIESLEGLNSLYTELTKLDTICSIYRPVHDIRRLQIKHEDIIEINSKLKNYCHPSDAMMRSDYYSRFGSDMSNFCAFLETYPHSLRSSHNVDMFYLLDHKTKNSKEASLHTNSTELSRPFTSEKLKYIESVFSPPKLPPAGNMDQPYWLSAIIREQKIEKRPFNTPISAIDSELQSKSDINNVQDIGTKTGNSENSMLKIVNNSGNISNFPRKGGSNADRIHKSMNDNTGFGNKSDSTSFLFVESSSTAKFDDTVLQKPLPIYDKITIEPQESEPDDKMPMRTRKEKNPLFVYSEPIKIVDPKLSTKAATNEENTGSELEELVSIQISESYDPLDYYEYEVNRKQTPRKREMSKHGAEDSSEIWVKKRRKSDYYCCSDYPNGESDVSDLARTANEDFHNEKPSIKKLGSDRRESSPNGLCEINGSLDNDKASDYISDCYNNSSFNFINNLSPVNMNKAMPGHAKKGEYSPLNENKKSGDRKGKVKTDQDDTGCTPKDGTTLSNRRKSKLHRNSGEDASVNNSTSNELEEKFTTMSNGTPDKSKKIVGMNNVLEQTPNSRRSPHRSRTRKSRRSFTELQISDTTSSIDSIPDKSANNSRGFPTPPKFPPPSRVEVALDEGTKSCISSRNNQMPDKKDAVVAKEKPSGDVTRSFGSEHGANNVDVKKRKMKDDLQFRDGKLSENSHLSKHDVINNPCYEGVKPKGTNENEDDKSNMSIVVETIRQNVIQSNIHSIIQSDDSSLHTSSTPAASFSRDEGELKSDRSVSSGLRIEEVSINDDLKMASPNENFVPRVGGEITPAEIRELEIEPSQEKIDDSGSDKEGIPALITPAVSRSFKKVNSEPGVIDQELQCGENQHEDSCSASTQMVGLESEYSRERTPRKKRIRVLRGSLPLSSREEESCSVILTITSNSNQIMDSDLLREQTRQSEDDYSTRTFPDSDYSAPVKPKLLKEMQRQQSPEQYRHRYSSSMKASSEMTDTDMEESSTSNSASVKFTPKSSTSTCDTSPDVEPVKEISKLRKPSNESGDMSKGGNVKVIVSNLECADPTIADICKEGMVSEEDKNTGKDYYRSAEQVQKEPIANVQPIKGQSEDNVKKRRGDDIAGKRYNKNVGSAVIENNTDNTSAYKSSNNNEANAPPGYRDSELKDSDYNRLVHPSFLPYQVRLPKLPTVFRPLVKNEEEEELQSETSSEPQHTAVLKGGLFSREIPVLPSKLLFKNRNKELSSDSQEKKSSGGEKVTKKGLEIPNPVGLIKSKSMFSDDEDNVHGPLINAKIDAAISEEPEVNCIEPREPTKISGRADGKQSLPMLESPIKTDEYTTIDAADDLIVGKPPTSTEQVVTKKETSKKRMVNGFIPLDASSDTESSDIGPLIHPDGFLGKDPSSKLKDGHSSTHKSNTALSKGGSNKRKGYRNTSDTYTDPQPLNPMLSTDVELVTISAPEQGEDLYALVSASSVPNFQQQSLHSKSEGKFDTSHLIHHTNINGEKLHNAIQRKLLQEMDMRHEYTYTEYEPPGGSRTPIDSNVEEVEVEEDSNDDMYHPSPNVVLDSSERRSSDVRLRKSLPKPKFLDIDENEAGVVDDSEPKSLSSVDMREYSRERLEESDVNSSLKSSEHTHNSLPFEKVPLHKQHEVSVERAVPSKSSVLESPSYDKLKDSSMETGRIERHDPQVLNVSTRASTTAHEEDYEPVVSQNSILKNFAYENEEGTPHSPSVLDNAHSGTFRALDGDDYGNEAQSIEGQDRDGSSQDVQKVFEGVNNVSDNKGAVEEPQEDEREEEEDIDDDMQKDELLVRNFVDNSQRGVNLHKPVSDVHDESHIVPAPKLEVPQIIDDEIDETPSKPLFLEESEFSSVSESFFGPSKTHRLLGHINVPKKRNTAERKSNKLFLLSDGTCFNMFASDNVVFPARTKPVPTINPKRYSTRQCFVVAKPHGLNIPVDINAGYAKI